jgi:hypothetical protein
MDFPLSTTRHWIAKGDLTQYIAKAVFPSSVCAARRKKSGKLLKPDGAPKKFPGGGRNFL